MAESFMVTCAEVEPRRLDGVPAAEGADADHARAGAAVIVVLPNRMALPARPTAGEHGSGCRRRCSRPCQLPAVKGCGTPARHRRDRCAR